MKDNKWTEYDRARAKPRVGVVLDRDVIERGKQIAEAAGLSFSAWLNALALKAIEKTNKASKKGH
jgi:hypothetical protein